MPDILSPFQRENIAVSICLERNERHALGIGTSWGFTAEEQAQSMAGIAPVRRAD